MRGEPIGLQGRRLKQRQQFLENRFRLLDLLDQPCPVYIVIFHDNIRASDSGLQGADRPRLRPVASQGVEPTLTQSRQDRKEDGTWLDERLHGYDRHSVFYHMHDALWMLLANPDAVL